MTKAEAFAKWAEVYTNVLNSNETKVYCLKTAIEYGIADMVNQTKGMSDADAAFMISDDADWMTEKLEKAGR